MEIRATESEQLLKRTPPAEFDPKRASHCLTSCLGLNLSTLREISYLLFKLAAYVSKSATFCSILIVSDRIAAISAYGFILRRFRTA